MLEFDLIFDQFLLTAFINIFLFLNLSLIKSDDRMRLRPKKSLDLSEKTIYHQFNKQFSGNSTRKVDNFYSFHSDFSPTIRPVEDSKHRYAEILTQFIQNVNAAKHIFEQNSSKESITRKNSKKQQKKIKKSRKLSSALESVEQKRESSRKPTTINFTRNPRNKIEQQSHEKQEGNISTSFYPTNLPEPSNFPKQFPQQNIINNYYWGSLQTRNEMSPQFPFGNFNLQSQAYYPWLQLNPFLRHNIENVPFINEELKLGLSRQLQIYQNYCSRKQPVKHEKVQQPLSTINQNRERKRQQKITSQSKKIIPDKVFKRASYHAGIAYSIYIDQIKKKGLPIKSFSDIDPTREARKIKEQQKKY